MWNIHRNPTMNNKDHLVGQLTKATPDPSFICKFTGRRRSPWTHLLQSSTSSSARVRWGEHCEKIVVNNNYFVKVDEKPSNAGFEGCKSEGYQLTIAQVDRPWSNLTLIKLQYGKCDENFALAFSFVGRCSSRWRWIKTLQWTKPGMSNITPSNANLHQFNVWALDFRNYFKCFEKNMDLLENFRFWGENQIFWNFLDFREKNSFFRSWVPMGP